ncbi:glutathione S-transferase T2-like [Setaria italica]|uniref:glutathione S-transferase T2-like n=1 Tax=Setaria italica TaxID=4555 RepID=UPI0006480120|nr:glutathione S-transferase T2-like [Setaria italica]
MAAAAGEARARALLQRHQPFAPPPGEYHNFGAPADAGEEVVEAVVLRTPASAWLNNSNDPIRANDKKYNSFWNDIAEEFNKNAAPGRERDTNQLKIHWSRLKTVIADFNGCWTKVNRVHKSGASDDQMMDEALALYTERYKKPFTLIHWWRNLKNEPKWCAHVAQLEKEKNESQPPIDIDDDIQTERPIRRDAAKASGRRNSKRKTEEVIEGFAILGGNIDKIVAVTQERAKTTEAHLEISRMRLKAAQEEKEAKMLQVYDSLLHQDTSQMTEESKARRKKTLAMMEKKLFSNNEV